MGIVITLRFFINSAIKQRKSSNHSIPVDDKDIMSQISLHAANKRVTSIKGSIRRKH